MRKTVLFVSATLSITACNTKNAEVIRNSSQDSISITQSFIAFNPSRLASLAKDVQSWEPLTEDGCGESATSYLAIDTTFQDSLAVATYINRANTSNALSSIAQRFGSPGITKISHFRPSLRSVKLASQSFIYCFGKDISMIPKSPRFILTAEESDGDTIAYGGLSQDLLPAKLIDSLTSLAPSMYSYYVADTVWIFSFGSCIKQRLADSLIARFSGAGCRAKLVISR